MSESLIPERPVIVSPSLAASIGLEEAILLQHLEAVLALGMGETRDGYHWTTTQLCTLNQQLPFWTTAALRRILNNLVDLGMVLVKAMPKDENQTLELTINQQVRYQNQPASQVTQTTSLGAQRIVANWRPDRAILDQLNQQGIDLKFVEANIDEFVF